MRQLLLDMAGHFSHDIVTALKEAAVKVFWTRAQLRTMLNIAGVDQKLINSQDWNQYKYHILSPIVDTLNTSEGGLGALRLILRETLRYKSCDHLLRYNDGKKLKKEAERALEHLRGLAQEHDSAKATEKEERDARRRRIEEAQKGRVFQEKLGNLRERYLKLLVKDDENERGYDLEKLLNELFALFELAPHSPFKRRGEQIDGAFVLDRDNFLLEAKWQKRKSNLGELRDLDGAVSSSLDNTLGLFLAVSGFTEDAISGYIEGNRPRMICMDGGDVMLVLDSRIDLSELLFRKKEVAAQRRQIFVSANDIILGRC
jgi:hypothetical protein